MKNTHIQQGDVIMTRIESLPAKLKVLKTDVVQEGEHTGHAHRLNRGDAQVFIEPKTKVKYLRLVKPTFISHEEHDGIMLPAGDYLIDIVKEYDHFEEEARAVAD